MFARFVHDVFLRASADLVLLATSACVGAAACLFNMFVACVMSQAEVEAGRGMRARAIRAEGRLDSCSQST